MYIEPILLNFRKVLLPLILFVFALICTSCKEPKSETKTRIMDPWAFRSVLDKKPRMLTLAFDSVNFAAYDLAKGQLYKVWNGGVTKEGTVFTNKKTYSPPVGVNLIMRKVNCIIDGP